MCHHGADALEEKIEKKFLLCGTEEGTFYSNGFLFRVSLKMFSPCHRAVK